MPAVFASLHGIARRSRTVLSCCENCCPDCQVFKDGTFKDLASDQKALLIKHAKARLFGPGEALFLAGDSGTAIYWIRSGLIKLHEDVEPGKSQTFALCGPGDLLGMSNLFDAPLRLNGTAVVPSLCCVFAAGDVRRLVMTSPTFSLDLLRVLRERQEEAYKRIEALAHYSTEKRVAAFLCELACDRVDGVCFLRDREINIGLTHEEVGELLGTSRESVTKVFNLLQRKGLIKIREHILTIEDPHTLFSPICGKIEDHAIRTFDWNKPVAARR